METFRLVFSSSARNSLQSDLSDNLPCVCLCACIILQKRGSEKGVIEICNIKAVEDVDVSAFERSNAFQVGHRLFPV